MLELIKTIAMLCAVSAGDQPSMANQASVNEQMQIACHAYYVKCVAEEKGEVGAALAGCIMRRAKK